MMQFWVSVGLVLLALYAGLGVLLAWSGRQLDTVRWRGRVRFAWACWGLGVVNCLFFLAVWFA